MRKSVVSWLSLFSVLCCTASVAVAGVRADETRPVSGFHGVSNSGSIKVEVTLGNTESVRLTGDDDLIDEIETVVENGILKIRYKNQRRTEGRQWGTVTAYVAARRLDALSQSGSGSIIVSGRISGDELNGALSGSGSLTFDADVAECNASISGSGRITVNGKAERTNVTLSGSGRFSGEKLKSGSASLQLSGSGNIFIYAENQLNASISGSGNVHYSGNAQTNVRTSGSGRLRKM